MRSNISMLESINVDTNKPAFAPAWNPANLHKVNMDKRNPPAPPKPKDPTPTLKDFKKKNLGVIRCFNGSAVRDLVRAGAEPELSFPPGAKRSLSQIPSNESSFHSNSVLTDSSMHEAKGGQETVRPETPTTRRREILELQRKEDDQRRMEGLRKSVKRAQQRKDDEFKAAYEKLKEEEQTFVSSVDTYLKNKEQAQQQRRRGLHAEWTECVFNKIQDQLLDRIDNMKEIDIQAKRRDLFQNYIDAASRKGGGLFLDIVIENEYDPFVWKKDTLRYRAKPAKLSNGPGFTDRFGNPVFDPVKRDLEKLKTEAKAATAVGGGASVLEQQDMKVGRETLGHEHWSKMEATPFYDRAAKVHDAIAAGRKPPVRKGTKTTIEIDDFEYPAGPNCVTKEIHGIYGRGKRVWQDWQPGKSLHKTSSVGAG
eukprot:CAMPEP_0181313080 /NCGR_PEP_ID=MMETSP1101-20121128/14054_1 /TAXON_ID=46948 /ORGANISM="Rhodomonas abbreviata, Strain Caron Lab Isolate" /LENGTH=423 /DNA_ID=CAMNT_0023420003 /DNA_START=140 /DNA_END=1407 /DNA_ORIENTATION=-